MQTAAQKYLTTETLSSTVCNALLNLGAAYAIFHARPIIPTGGPTGLVRDLIGETFLAVSLSSLIPALILRHRHRSGAFLSPEMHAPQVTRSPYLTAIALGLLFTCVFVPLNAFLLPHIFPEGIARFNVLLYKTLYGAILGGTSTFLTLRNVLHSNA